MQVATPWWSFLTAAQGARLLQGKLPCPALPSPYARNSNRGRDCVCLSGSTSEGAGTHWVRHEQPVPPHITPLWSFTAQLLREHSRRNWSRSAHDALCTTSAYEARCQVRLHRARTTNSAMPAMASLTCGRSPTTQERAVAAWRRSMEQ